MKEGREKACDEEKKRKEYSTFYSNVWIVSFKKEGKRKKKIERENLVWKNRQTNK